MKNHQLITDYYIAHRDELLAFVSSRLGGSDLAEDIVQNVFLRLLTTDKMISEVTLPCLHYIKGVCSTEISTDSIFSVREVMEGLERGLARLPENCREVYRLHVYGGMKVSEISLRLGEGYKSVEHRLGTARKVMRQYMRRYA